MPNPQPVYDVYTKAEDAFDHAMRIAKYETAFVITNRISGAMYVTHSETEAIRIVEWEHDTHGIVENIHIARVTAKDGWTDVRMEARFFVPVERRRMSARKNGVATPPRTRAVPYRIAHDLYRVRSFFHRT